MKKSYIPITAAFVVKIINQFQQGRAAALALLAALLALRAAPAAHALTWDTVSGDNPTITDGSGNWNLTAGNLVWNNNANPNVIWSQTSTTVGSQAAVFGSGTDGTVDQWTVTLGSQMAATSLTFNNTGYKITGSPIQVSTSGTVNGSITVAAGKTASINSTIGYVNNAGASITVNSGGTLNLRGGAGNAQYNFSGAGTVNMTAGTYSANTGTAGAATFNHSGGTFDITPGNNVTYIISSGSRNVNYTLSATGLLTVNNGSVNTTASTPSLTIGNGTGVSLSTLTVNGGTLIVATNGTRQGEIRIGTSAGNGKLDVQAGAVTVGSGNATNKIYFFKGGGGATYSATMTQSSGTVTANGIQFGGVTGTYDPAASATLQLSGGSLYVGAQGIALGSAAGALPVTIQLQGGTLGADQAWSSSLDMKLGTTGGGPTIRAQNSASTARNITLSGILLDDTAVNGTLTKTGAGTLTLSGASANNFSGATLVSAGTLDLGKVSAVSSSSSVTIASGAALALSTSSSTAPNLTFANTGTLNFNVAGGYSLTVSGTDGVTNSGAAGSITINITGSAPANGTHTLIAYSGSLKGSGFSAYQLGTTPVGKTYALNDTGSAVQLVVTSLLTWTGAQSTEWSTATIAGWKNWTLGGSPADYADGNLVVFDDTATGYTVDLSVADVTPSYVSFNNNGGTPYTLQGSKAIAGACPLVKEGTGTLAIINSNTYTGGTTISAGTLQLGDGTSGHDGTIAASPAVTNSGALVYNRFGSASYGGVISGSGTVTMSGTGTQTLTGVNTYTGNTTISGGTLEIGDPGTLGGGTYNGAIDIASGASLEYRSSVATTLQTGAITGGGSITVNCPGQLGLRGTAATSFSGGVTVINGLLNGAGNPAALGTGGVTMGGSGSTGATFIGGQNFSLVNFTINTPDSGNIVIGANGTGSGLNIGSVTLNNSDLQLQTFALGKQAGVNVGGGVTGTGNLILNNLNNGTAPSGIINLSGSYPINNIGSITHQGVGTTSDTITAPIGANVTSLIQDSATSPLVINGNPSFTGTVVVKTGTLVLNDLFSLPNASSVTISNGGALSLPSISTTMPNLTFVNTGSISFNVAGSGAQLTVSAADGVTNNGAAGSITLNIIGSAPANGNYTLIAYSGSLRGSGFSAYKLGATPSGKSYALNDTGSAVELVVSEANVWTGAQCPEWSTATIAGSKNWAILSSPVDYTNGNAVLFDDTTTSNTVDVSVADVTPFSVSFNNTAQSYVLQGSKAIAGACGLVKEGAGTLTIINSNTYSGPTIITAGTLQLGNGTIGQDGSIASSQTTIATNATLVFNRVGSSTFGGIISGSGSVTVTNTGTLTLSGSNAITGKINVYGGNLLINNWGGSAFNGGTINYGGTVVIGSASSGNFTITSGQNFSIGNATLVGQADGVGTGYQTNGTLHLGTAALNLAVGGTAVYHLIGGTITNTSSGLGQGIRIVANQNAGIGGVATFNQSGGNINMPLGTLEIGRADQQITFPAGATQRATFNQSGGTATVGKFLVGGATGFTVGVFATNNMTGGSFTATTFPVLANGPDDVVAFNLGGSAQVTLPAFPTARGAGATAAMTLDFTNGWLSPLAASATYLPAGTFDNAYLTANGAKFNVGTNNDITVGQILRDAPSAIGTLTKSGLGKLTLSGANTYTGATTVSGGTLAIVQAYLGSTASVAISNAAMLQLDFGTTNVVGALILAGAPQLPGVYNSNNAGSYITGSGSLKVVGTGPSGPAMLTNSVSGGVLSLSWPAGQGWRLEYQTNALNQGLGTNWLPAAGSSINSTNITIDTTKPTSFYRLIYP